MPSKLDQLRAGESIEFEPGLFGRLNKNNKTLELSSGRVLNVANDPDYFPADEASLNLSKQREYAEKGAKGIGGEFFHQFTNQGLPGSISDIAAYLTQTGDQYATRKRAQQEISERISEESPYISGAATAANIATDLALTRGMSAFKAAPILTVGSSGSSILTEPDKVVGDALISAGAGYVLDKATGGLSRMADRRKAIRDLPGRQADVEAQNILGQQNVANANAAQQQQYNFLKQNVKNVNENRLKQYQTDLDTRKNNMISSQNAYEQARANREASIVRLENQRKLAQSRQNAQETQLTNQYKIDLANAEQQAKRLEDEYKLAQKQYQETLKKIPILQKQAQAEYSGNVVRNAEKIEKVFPKNSKIATDDLGIAQFVEDNVSKSGLAGTTEANQIKRILTSMFPEGELIGGRELSKSYKALEESIQRSAPEVRDVLNQFKEYLGQRLPSIVEDSVAYHKIYPLLKRSIEADVRAVMNEIPFLGKGMKELKENLTEFAIAGANNQVRQGITPSNFIQKLKSGDLSKEISQNLLTAEDFFFDLTKSQMKDAEKQGVLPYLMQEAEKKHAFFVSELSKRLDNKLARYEIKAIDSANKVGKQLSNEIKSTYGLAENVPIPNPPIAPNPVQMPSPPQKLPPIPQITQPPPITPPTTPPIPVKPSLMTEPTSPTPQSFTPQPLPTLAPPQGMLERTADVLERPLLTGGNTLVNNPITKLAGLKYLLGKGALPLEAGYGALKGLTSPSAVGEISRMTFKQGGIQAVKSWAEKYPSYRDGILDNPQDRRSLTKEIEDAPDIPIEQKAILQSKINRGKNLEQSL